MKNVDIKENYATIGLFFLEDVGDSQSLPQRTNGSKSRVLGCSGSRGTNPRLLEG